MEHYGTALHCMKLHETPRNVHNVTNLLGSSKKSLLYEVQFPLHVMHLHEWGTLQSCVCIVDGEEGVTA